jgi:hypothetical protein
VQQDGASGHVLYLIPLRNKSETTCALVGYPPTFSATNAAGARVTEVHQGAYFPDPPAGDLAPGADGLVVLDANSHCADDFPGRAVEAYRDIHLGMRGGGSVSLGTLEITTCALSVSQLGIEPTASRPAGVRACRGTDLRADSDTVGAGMSHRGTRVALKNISASPCWLAGYPTRATARDAKRSLVELPIGATYSGSPLAGVVRPGAFGEVVIETTSACEEMVLPQPQHVVYDHVTLELRGGGRVSLGARTFDATCSIVVSALGLLTDSAA